MFQLQDAHTNTTKHSPFVLGYVQTKINIASPCRYSGNIEPFGCNENLNVLFIEGILKQNSSKSRVCFK